MDDAEQDAERFESIPWSTLLPESRPPLSRWVVIAAIAVVVVVGVVVVGRGLSGAESRSPVAAPRLTDTSLVPPAATTATDASAATQPVTASTAVMDESVPPPTPYSEADLMAALPDEIPRSVVVRAEWFVTDFFTMDGDQDTSTVLSPSTPHGAATPERGDALASSPSAIETDPGDVGGGVSYVEWARATDAERVDDRSYEVVVAFRTLAGPFAGEVIRQPVRTVAVRVGVDEQGRTHVLDLPEPRVTEAAVAARPIALELGPVPDDVSAAIVDRATTAGFDAEVVGGGRDAHGWRVTINMRDPSGLVFPMVVHQPG